MPSSDKTFNSDRIIAVINRHPTPNITHPLPYQLALFLFSFPLYPSCSA